MTNQPLVSVLIPTYNCAKYIAQAIESVVEQDYDNLEIVVVDDGSTDETSAVIKNLTGFQNLLGLSTLKYFRKPHSGISATRNFALEKARGELLAWLDADDHWAADKLKKQLEYMREIPDCEVVFTRFENFFEDETLKDHPRMQHEIRYAQTSRQHFTTSLAKRTVFEKTGEFKNAVGEDLEIVARMMTSGVDVNHCLPDVYYYRRLHGVNSIITMDYNVKNIIFPNLAENLRKKIGRK